MSRRSASASVMMRSCSEASASRDWRRGGPGPLAVPAGCRQGHRVAWLVVGRGSPGGATRRRRVRRGLGSRLQLGSGAHQHGHGRERVVGEGPVVEQRVDGTPEAQRVERLDQPALGARPAGQEDVGPAVEQHEHRDVVRRVVGLLQPQLQADGHAAHVAHLHVDDDQVGRFLGDERHHLGARGHGSHLDVGPADDGLDLPAERRCVAGDQDGLHRRDTIGPACRVGNPLRPQGCAAAAPRGGPPALYQAKRWSAARRRPTSSCTSCPKSGIRPTGAGATWAASPAKAASSRAATAFSSARFASSAARPGARAVHLRPDRRRTTGRSG